MKLPRLNKLAVSLHNGRPKAVGARHETHVFRINTVLQKAREAVGRHKNATDMAEMQRRFTADLGIPCAGFDGDQADPRNFNEAQYETRVQGLVEAMAENAKNKEG